MSKSVVFGPVHGSSFIVGCQSVLILVEDPSDLSFCPALLLQPCYQEYDWNCKGPSNETGNVSFVVIWGIGDRIENDRPP